VECRLRFEWISKPVSSEPLVAFNHPCSIFQKPVPVGFEIFLPIWSRDLEGDLAGYHPHSMAVLSMRELGDQVAKFMGEIIVGHCNLAIVVWLTPNSCAIEVRVSPAARRRRASARW
jgi:hypothetical protein